MVLIKHRTLLHTLADSPDALGDRPGGGLALEDVAREPLHLGVFGDEAQVALVARQVRAERDVLQRVEVVQRRRLRRPGRALDEVEGQYRVRH